MKKTALVIFVLVLILIISGCASNSFKEVYQSVDASQFYAQKDEDCDFIIEVSNQTKKDLSFITGVFNKQYRNANAFKAKSEKIIIAAGEKKNIKYDSELLMAAYAYDYSVGIHCFEKNWYWWYDINNSMKNQCMSIVIDSSKNGQLSWNRIPDASSKKTTVKTPPATFTNSLTGDPKPAKQVTLFEKPSDDILIFDESIKGTSSDLKKTGLEKVYITKFDSGNGIKEGDELKDIYLYSKNQKKIVACIKDCSSIKAWFGTIGWNGNPMEIYAIPSKNKRVFYAEISDYKILEEIDGQLWDVFSKDVKVTASSETLKAGELVTFKIENAASKYVLICGRIKDSKQGFDACLKTICGGEEREASILVPYGYEKLMVFPTNHVNYFKFKPYEKTIKVKKENGRTLKIPDSYEKALHYKSAKVDSRVNAILSDKELDAWRSVNPDAYLDEVINRINNFAADDFEKVTAIHDFIASLICYDHDGVYVYHTEVPDDYPTVLKLRKGKCYGYATLFNEMCGRAGIVCSIVSGYARGYGWSQKDNVKETNHSWNIVKLDGEWYLIDCTWDSGNETNGARHVSCHHGWLFVMPDIFIKSHLPSSDELQLLQKPVSAGQFKKLRY